MNPNLRAGLIAVGGAIAAWVAVAARKAVKNWGKTKWEIASEHYEEALKAAQAAHADSDPKNDNAADANVEKQRKIRDHYAELMAITSAVGDTDAPR